LPPKAEASACAKAKTASRPVFADDKDPDYAALLKAISETRDKLDEIKRFDMHGFRPNIHYLREMTNYGILPTEVDPHAPIDPYATDRAYWKSLLRTPP